MMHSLFLKIFLCFWLTMTLASAVLVASDTQRMERTRQNLKSMTAAAFSVYADSAADANENTRTWEAREYLADLEKRTGVRAWLFDPKNREISGYAPRQRAAQTPETQLRLRQLIARARRSRQTEFEPVGGVTLAARTATSSKGRNLVLAGELPIARFGLRDAEPHLQGLRLAAILLASGVVCGALSRYLTRPIVALRGAAQRFSGGDLRARAHVTDKRRDELAELSRDFNRMAERIEKLLAEQIELVRAQRRLLGDVSHELRSPLARATVALELARDHLEAGDKTALIDSFGRIERETARQGELIDRLLVMARLESGLIERGTAPIPLDELLRAVVADADYEARPHRRAVVVTQSETCSARGTPVLLRAALENVIRNAVRHAPENSEVQVSLKVENAPDSLWAIIQVLDQGDGVPEAELEAIFRPFHRSESARDRARGGAGLGLTIAARGVKLHGGHITASNAQNGGLNVEIRLPCDRA